jgi:hypothetical protein
LYRLYDKNMVEQALITYIKSQISQGKKSADIKTELLTRGFGQNQIEEAYAQLTNSALNPDNKTKKIRFPIGPGMLFIILVCGLILIMIATITIMKHNAQSQNTIAAGTKASPTFPVVQSTSAPTTLYANPSTKEINCGTAPIHVLTQNPQNHSQSLSCFINAANSCTPATVLIHSTGDFSNGQIEISDTTNTIEGVRQGKCILSIAQGKITNTFPSSVPQSQQQSLNETLQKLVGRTGICLFSNDSDLSKVFINFQNGNFSTETSDTYKNGVCSGTYFAQE